MRGSIDTLELELRRLPGVVSVSFSNLGDNQTMRVLAPTPADVETVRRMAHQLTRSHLDEPVTIEIDDNGAGRARAAEADARPPADRVRLIAVRNNSEENELEVHLEYGELRTVGRGTSITLAGAAEATIEALEGFGVHVPYEVKAATPLGSSLSEAVVVVLRSDDTPGGERFGVAANHSQSEASVRATLHALNRFLATTPALNHEIDLTTG